jgi:hypothetical protein
MQPAPTARQDRTVLFSADSLTGLADGSITVTFRRWRRAQARAGGRYRVTGLLIEADAVTQVPVGVITDADARAAGERDRAALVDRLRRQAADPPLDDDTLVWRVDFHLVGRDDREVLRQQADLDPDDVVALDRRLDRLDRASPHGPWTRQVLRLVAARPGVVSTELAATLGRERASFKLDVRKLKELGLTESLLVGYRLSPRAEAYLARRHVKDA